MLIKLILRSLYSQIQFFVIITIRTFLVATILTSLTIAAPIFAQQDTVKINNGSFESIPQQGRTDLRTFVEGWDDCGRLLFPLESPPDIHPNNYWNNNVPASHGETYLGMVVRDVESWESMTQRLRFPLEQGKCYKFSINLAASDKYVSASRKTGKTENYTTPVVLNIWGGNSWCGNNQLLTSSPPIDHRRWKRYDFEFECKGNFKYLTLEAFYKIPVLVPYNGNILIDKLTDFTIVPCEEDQLIANVDHKLPPHKRKPKRQTKKDPIKSDTNKAEETTEVIRPKKKKILAELDRKKLHTGKKIRIDQLYFKADTSSISATSYPVLDEVYDFMKKNKKIVIEIGGHTNNIPAHDYCDRLSKARAKEVAKYLLERGLSADRVTYRGYGKRKPVASNFSKEGRRKNQRVEIKILSLNG